MQKPTEPFYINRFLTGLWSFRSPLATPFSYMGLQRMDRVDVVLDGADMELSDKQTWQRRAGFTKYDTGVLQASEIPLDFFSYKKADGSIKVICDTNQRVLDITTQGSWVVLHTKTSALQSTFRAIGDVLYFTTGDGAFKWISSKTNMGAARVATAPTIGLVAGALSPTVGFKYVGVGKNSSTLHRTTATNLSASTGPQTSKNFQLTGTRYTDAQIDKVEIYRTLDGGSTLFFDAEIANPPTGDWSYTDSTPDSGLNKSFIAPVNHINDPPPTGLTNLCFHVGRMWGSVGNKVYYASGAQTYNGVPEEAWALLNVFPFPGQVIDLVPTSSGLLVLTDVAIYIIRGLDPTSFYPQLFLDGVGIGSRNAVLLDGETLVIFTTRKQLLSFSAAQENLGLPITDTVLTNFNPTTTYLTAHANSDVDSGMFMSDGVSKIIRYSPGLRAWSVPYNIVGGCRAIRSVLTPTGDYFLLTGRAAGAGYILKRDMAVFQDDGTSYAPTLTFGSLILAPPGKLVTVKSVYIERVGVGTHPTVAILPNEISGTFINLGAGIPEPPELPATTSVVAKRHPLMEAATPIPQIMRHLQVKFTFASENAKSELIGFGLEAA